MYSWDDTGCSGKHAYFDGFLEGKSVNVTGFTSTLGSIDNIPIDNVLYEFYKEGGTVVLIEHNNTIYMGDDMIDYLANSIQCEDNGVRVNLRPAVYYPNNNNTKSIIFPDGNSIPVEYDGVLPRIAVRKPTKYEVENCERNALTSKLDWGLYGHLNGIESVLE